MIKAVDPVRKLDRKKMTLLVSAGLAIGMMVLLLFSPLTQEAMGKVLSSLLVGDANHSLALNGDQPASSPVKGQVQAAGNENLQGLPSEFSKLAETYQMILSSYYDKKALDKNLLLDGAIKGMIEALDDPYTTYMDKEENAQFEDSLSSSFEGIGTEVMMLNNRVTIVSPFKDSPAEKAGLKPNDQIISVDGVNIEGLDLQEAVKKIRGPKGTKVKLGILREGLTDPLTVIVTRDTIPLESVYRSVEVVDGKKLGRLEITSFSENTADRFFEEFDRLKQEGVKGVVIDLRGNPGGYLDAVLSIGERIIPKQGVILQIEDRDGKRVKYASKLKGEGFPIVVLIDEGSASASEILAGALKAAGYPIVGKNSFGKGTVQVTKDLKDGSTIKITVAKWLTPDGTWIHKKGIQPTLTVDQPEYFQAAPLHAETPLKREMNGSEVQNLQKVLAGLGYALSRNDGYFDASTEAAVRLFQQNNKLPVTGIVDKNTAEKLQEQLIAKIKNPANDAQLQAAYTLLAGMIK